MESQIATLKSKKSVLLVDDSPFFATQLSRSLQQDPSLQVWTVYTQAEGISVLKKSAFDVVVWDIVMLNPDSLCRVQALKKKARLVLLRASDIEALRWREYNPESDIRTSVAQKPKTLLDMVAFREVYIHGLRNHSTSPSTESVVSKTYTERLKEHLPLVSPCAIGVVASTGGPAALVEMLQVLPKEYPIPIFIVQHMSGGFMSTFCDWLNSRLALSVQVATHRQLIRAGVWLAPDGAHLEVSPSRMLLNSELAAVQFSKPSGDVLLRSIGAVFGVRSLGVVMTGLGQDGAQGLSDLSSHGGQVYVQSPATCVVPGMVEASMSCCRTERALSIETLSPVELGTLLQGFAPTRLPPDLP